MRKFKYTIVSKVKIQIAKIIVKILLESDKESDVRSLLGELYTKGRFDAHVNNAKKIRSTYNIHPSVIWGLDTKIYGDGQISVGENTYFGRDCQILSNTPDTKLIIGKCCSISHNVHIRTEIHKRMFHWSDERTAPPMGADIVIGDYVWIGANAFIKGGITIGENSIVGANSVVTSNVPPNTVYGGVPTRFIRNKSDYFES